MNATKKQFLPQKLKFDSERALIFFKTMEEWWGQKKGFFAGLSAPQIKYFPEDLRNDPVGLGQWFFFMAIPMRGGINSEEAFRFVYELRIRYPELFDAKQVMHLTSEEISKRTKGVASAIHKNGSNGAKEEGTFSFQSLEHSNIWIHNASTLANYWGGDIRNVFWGVGDFEESFRRVDHKKNKAGFRGMRRKIFSLLVTWLQEFEIIHKFPMPLIIDFHAMRLLLELDVMRVAWSEFGPNNPQKKDRLRPKSMWKYPAFKVSEKLVDEIIMWSQKFLQKHNLNQYDVAHGIWFLSRELCRYYLGNQSIESKETRITERLYSDDELKDALLWSPNYRDLCLYCPVEQMCKKRIPSGPYFEFGTFLWPGKHIIFPGRQNDLGIVERDEAASLRRNNNEIVRKNRLGNDDAHQFSLEI